MKRLKEGANTEENVSALAQQIETIITLLKDNTDKPLYEVRDLVEIPIKGAREVLKEMLEEGGSLTCDGYIDIYEAMDAFLGEAIHKFFSFEVIRRENEGIERPKTINEDNLDESAELLGKAIQAVKSSDWVECNLNDAWGKIEYFLTYFKEQEETEFFAIREDEESLCHKCLELITLLPPYFPEKEAEEVKA